MHDTWQNTRNTTQCHAMYHNQHNYTKMFTLQEKLAQKNLQNYGLPLHALVIATLNLYEQYTQQNGYETHTPNTHTPKYTHTHTKLHTKHTQNTDTKHTENMHRNMHAKHTQNTHTHTHTHKTQRKHTKNAHILS